MSASVVETRSTKYRVFIILLIAGSISIPAVTHADIIPNVPVGPIEFISLDYTPGNLISARITGNTVDDLIVTYNRPGISVLSGDDFSLINTEFTVSLIEPLRQRNGHDVIVCVPHDRKEVKVLRFETDENVFRKVWSKELTSQPYLLRTADVSNNGHNDILLLLEDRPGVGILQNRGDGRFGDIEFLFDDILVSMFQVVDLNGDGINDFILYDPIRNILRFHFGFGRMSFSLERYHSLPASINYFKALPVAEEGIYDLVASFPDYREFRVYLGDGLGRYSHIQTRNISAREYSFLFTDLFRTGRPDLIIAEQETGKLRLYKNREKRGFEPAGIVLFDSGIRDLVVRRNRRTGINELYFLDGNQNRISRLTLLPAVKDYLPDKLALASEPTDIVAANLFGGELPELYILCKEASTISVYWYNRAFELNHSMITLPGNPDRLYVHRGPGRRTKLVAAEGESNIITIVSMLWDTFEVNVYGIPAMAGSDIIYLGVTPDNQFQFGTVAFTDKNGTPMLSMFEQIASDEYIEHTITPVEEGIMLALDIVDLTGNNEVDIVYMYRSENDGTLYITSALNESSYVFRRRGDTIALDEPDATRGFLLSENSAFDNNTSFIVYLDEDGKRNGRLFRIVGDREGLFSLLTANSGGKVIRFPKDIVLMPSAGNRFHDIVYYNTLTDRIEMKRSDRNGSFSGPKPIKRMNDLTAFTVYSEPFGEVHMLVAGRKGKLYIEVSKIEE